jgi:hypothetical protein
VSDDRVRPILLAMLGLLLLVLAARNVADRLAATRYTRELTPMAAPAYIGNGRGVRFGLGAGTRLPGTLWLFFSSGSLAASRGAPLRLELRDADGAVLAQRSVALAPKDMVSNALRVEFPRPARDGRPPFSVTVSQHSTPADQGLALETWVAWDARLGEGLEVDGAAVPGCLPGAQWLPAPEPWPWRTVAGAAVLVLLAFPRAPRGSSLRLLAILLAVGAGALALSTWCWEARLAEFWGHYWPDGYADQAHAYRRCLAGDLAFADLLAWLRGHRTAHVPLVPWGIAALASLGLGYLPAYVVLSAAAVLGAVAVTAIGASRCLGARDDRLTAALLVACGANVLTFRAMANPQSDGASFLAAVLALMAFERLWRTDPPRARTVALAAVAILGAAMTRFALLPLGAVPLGLGVAAALGGARWLRPAALAAAGVLGWGALGAIWWIAGMRRSIELNVDFAAVCMQVAPVTLVGFVKACVAGFQSALVAVLWLVARPRSAPIVPLLVLAVGVSPVALGMAPTFWRYWTPLLPAALLASSAAVAREDGVPAWWRWLLLVQAAANVAYVVGHPRL